MSREKETLRQIGASLCLKLAEITHADSDMKGVLVGTAVFQMLQRAYDSGYNAAIEDAARHFEEHYHCSECNPKEDFAAELRQLKKEGER